MRAMVFVEFEPDGVCRDAETLRELLAQRHAHGRETQRVFVAEKFAGSRAFVVAERGEGGILQRRVESEIDSPQ
jgi:hypothetical protein